MSEINHNGKKIQIVGDETPQKLLIDQKEFSFIFDNDTKTFSSLLLPYSRHDTLEDLGKAIVDNVGDI